MKIVVQKFGGTSVSSPQSREACADKIIIAKDNGYSVVVVVSAMGRKGAPYATDTLLSLPYNEKSSLREKDLLMSCGELISAVVMTSLLNLKGIKARTVTGYQAGIITDGNFGKAKCQFVDSGYIKKLLNEGITPVVTGFQGLGAGCEITTLGRGGSDTTAALLGGALKAEKIEIYTDVDGIMTADPRVVKDASIINEISSQEVFQMADQGANVIHPRAVEISSLGNIEMFIKNTFNTHEGTKISHDLLVHDPSKTNDVVSSVACLSNRAQVIINKLEEKSESHVLQTLAKEGISIDLINIFLDKMVVTIGESDVVSTNDILSNMGMDYEIIESLAKVTAIGAKMHNVPGVMAKIVTALLEKGCEILQSADSHMHISCLIHSKDTDVAVNALHDAFGLERTSN